MVLYKRKPIDLLPLKVLPENLDRQIWIIKETGEWFTTYIEYLERLDFYTRHYFTCEITGTSCLTFFEALSSEETQFQYVEERFPFKLREPIARFLHFNKIRRLDLLVEKVYSRFKNDFFPGEVVYLRKNKQDLSPIPEDLTLNLDSLSPTNSQKSYLIKEKAHFNSVIEPDTGKELSPAYSKYMLLEEQSSSSLIVDQSQIYRDRSTFTKYLIKCFCKITLRRASGKLGAPWCVKDDYLSMYGLSLEWPTDMIKYKDDYIDIQEHSISPFVYLSNEMKKYKEEIDFPKYKRFKPEELISLSNSKSEQFQQSVGSFENFQITSIKDDLLLPYTGTHEQLNHIYQYTEELELIPVNDKISLFSEMSKLLQCYQFLNTFNEKLCISNFSFDDFITSFKCTDPLYLCDKSVSIILGSQIDVQDTKLQNLDNVRETNIENEYSIKHKQNNINIGIHNICNKDMRCQLMNDKIYDFIEKNNSINLTYLIEKELSFSDNKLDDIYNNGTHLITECFISLLCLFIDTNGDWKIMILEDWYGEKQECHSSIDSNEEDNNENDDINVLLNKCLTFRNIHWSERLVTRKFQDGFWIIILLGIYQDCMHLPMYTSYIHHFIRSVVPMEKIGAQLNKHLWRNFCKNLVLKDKVMALWILIDLCSNFSQDIKNAMEDSMELCGNIRSERYKICKNLKNESQILSDLNDSLRSFNKSMEQTPEYREILNNIQNQDKKIAILQKDKSYLDHELFRNDLQRLKYLGMDRYGNRFYWLELYGLPRPSDKESLQNVLCGKIWIQGPLIEDSKFFLNIKEEQVKQWIKIMKEQGSVEATMQVFGVYRRDDGSYIYSNGSTEIILVNSYGCVNNSIILSPIQRKIIDETPEHLILAEFQWYTITNWEDFEKLIRWWDTWGKHEHDLLRQVRNVLKPLKTGLQSVSHECSETDTESKLYKKLLSNVLTKEELELAPDSFDEKDDSFKTDKELKSIIEEIIRLDNSSKTRKVVNRIKELEIYRDKLLKRLNDIQTGNKLKHTHQSCSDISKIKRLRDYKLLQQKNILTQLINLRRLKHQKSCSKWRNNLLSNLAKDNPHGNITDKFTKPLIKSVDEKLAEIMSHTSKNY